MINVEITESAQAYLRELLDKQENNNGIGIRLFVTHAGTPRAETCIAYCRPGEEQDDDEVMPLNSFKAFIESRSLPYLEDAKVDFATDRMGGQLTIRAPNARMPRISDNSPLEDRINYVLYNDVNPGLASHGGHVELIEITGDMYAVLKFGGGCQGCGSVELTLKHGVEATLMQKLPELKGIRDVTDHADRTHAYM